MKPDMSALIAAFSKANPDAARAVFNNVIAETPTESDRDMLEIAREYHCNPEFNRAMSDITFDLTSR